MTPRSKRLFILVTILTGLSTLGCGMFVDRAVNRAMGKAADKVGERVGGAIADNVIGGLRPEMMYLYTMNVFRVLFYHGGYYVSSLSYEPLEYTRWEASNVEQGDWFERTLMHRYSDGSEWWRVESRQKDEDDKEVMLIMEALLSKPQDNGTRQIRRMRAMFPGEKEAREIGITEGDANKWVLSSNRSLTKESMKGMSKGRKTVKVPAGTFSATHLQMKGYNDFSHLDWYLSKEVPGQVVKYRNVTKDGDEQKVDWNIELLAHGKSEAVSKLGVNVQDNDPENKDDNLE